MRPRPDRAVAVAGGSGRSRAVLPGRWPAFGLTLTWLGLLVLLPLAALAVRPWQEGVARLFAALAAPRTLAALRLSFASALGASCLCTLLGLLFAWVLGRIRPRGARLLDVLVDLPFALPTAVAGITFSTLYARSGWFGAPLAALGIKVAYTPLGIMIALVFIGLPLVVRSVLPVLEDMPREWEEAAVILGARPHAVAFRVILPALLPALVTGFALAFARGVGEYGSVIFIAGNKPFLSEIAPLLIVIRLEEFDYETASAIGLVMLLVASLILLLVGVLRRRLPAQHGAA